MAHLRGGKLEAALEPLKRAADLDPGDAWPLLLRSEALDRLDRTAEALADVESAVKLAPDLSLVYERRGKVLLRLDRPADAVKDLEKATTLDPSSAPRLDADLKAARARAHSRS
jgi:tetratricopeptide (TPR) repeat protein